MRRRIDSFRERFKHQAWLLGLGVLPIFIFAVLWTLMVWGLPASRIPLSPDQIWGVLSRIPLLHAPAFMAYVGYDHLVLWGELIIVVAWISAHAMLPARDWGNRLNELIFMLLAGLLTWTLVANLADFAFQAGTSQTETSILGEYSVHRAHLYAVLAVPTAVLAILGGMTLFIGLVSKFKWIEDEDREWWGRFGAWVVIGTVAWSLLSAITIFGPPLLLQFPKLLTAVGGVSGLLAVLLGKSSLTAATGQEPTAKPAGSLTARKIMGVNALAAVGVVFVIVLLAFLSLLSSALLQPILAALSVPPSGRRGRHPDLAARCGRHPAAPQGGMRACRCDRPTWIDGSVFNDANTHLEMICQAPLGVIGSFVLGLGLFLALASLAINLNKFSLHAAYRIRLVRTFLGASRGSNRQPNPFTGFDPLDDVQMHELQSGLIREAEIVNLSQFLQKLKDAHAGAAVTPAKYLVEQMCSRAYDREGVLKGRLAGFRSGTPVLKSLEQDVLETLNRVMETARLDGVAAFHDLLAVCEPVGGGCVRQIRSARQPDLRESSPGPARVSG